MGTSSFIKYLVCTIIVTVILFFFFNLFIPLASHLEILFLSILCYIILAVMIHFLVNRSMKNQQGKNMIGLVIFNVFLKLVFTFSFVAIYVQVRQPTDRFFLVPVLLTYLVFTIFETWFLNIQAKDVK